MTIQTVIVDEVFTGIDAIAPSLQLGILVVARSTIETRVVSTVDGCSLAEFSTPAFRARTVLPIRKVFSIEPVCRKVRLIRWGTQNTLSAILTVECAIPVFQEFAREASKAFGAQTALHVVLLALAIVHAKIDFVVFHVVVANRRSHKLAKPAVGRNFANVGRETIAGIGRFSVTLFDVTGSTVQASEITAGVVLVSFTGLPGEARGAFAILKVVVASGIQPNGKIV